MNVYALFADALRSNPGHPALTAGVGRRRRTVTFAALDRRVNAAIANFERHGLCPGDRVLLAVPVSIDTYVLMLALLKAGMVVMYIDPGHGPATAVRILDRWPPAAIVASRSILLPGLLFRELRRIPKRFVSGGGMPGAIRIHPGESSTATAPVATRAAADPAVLSFTSGTGGEPKALLRTHGFLRTQLRVLRQVADVVEDDIDFVAMPMFVLFNLANRITSVLPARNAHRPGRADPRTVLAQLRREKATRMVASPALLERLANYCLVLHFSLPDMRCIATGGGPVAPSLALKLRRIAPHAVVRIVYGSTEAEPIACIDANEVSIADREKSREGAGLLAGRPVRGIQVRIVDSQPGRAFGTLTEGAFARLCVPAGCSGEIVVSGKHVMRGYADPDHERHTKIRVNDAMWHRTGDAGYFDSRGRLWLVGRCNAALRDYRGTVYPFQVEYAVSEVRGVRRAALVEADGARVLVLETTGRSFNDCCAAAAICVARFGIDRIITLDRIPVDRRHDAKVDYLALKRRLDGSWRGYSDFAADGLTRAYILVTDFVTRRRVRIFRSH